MLSKGTLNHLSFGTIGTLLHEIVAAMFTKQMVALLKSEYPSFQPFIVLPPRFPDMKSSIISRIGVLCVPSFLPSLMQQRREREETLSGDDFRASSAGRQFNRKHFGLSFGLKNGLTFRFHSEACLNYTFLNIFLM